LNEPFLIQLEYCSNNNIVEMISSKFACMYLRTFKLLRFIVRETPQAIIDDSEFRKILLTIL